MDVAAGENHGEWDARSVGDQVVLGARSTAVNRARSGLRPPFSARTWEESTTARDQSILLAARNSARSKRCSRCHTPASFQSRNRRQHVIPDPKPSSLGQVFPADAGVQHVEDALQAQPVR
ncbi:hypothetical protein GCM10009634_48150 [Saccharothrix xinjiangensis]